MVHECAYHVQAKDEFQFLHVNGRFFKVQSHIKWKYKMVLLNVNCYQMCEVTIGISVVYMG